MIINGANFHTSTGTDPANHAAQKKNGINNIPAASFAKRYDTLELNDVLKKYSDTNKGSNDISDVRKMLSQIDKGGKDKSLAGGLVGYAYMSWSLTAADILLKWKNYEFDNCQKEKAYYQSLLDEKCNCSPYPDAEPLDFDAYDKIDMTPEDMQRLKEINEDLNVKIEMREYRFECGCCTTDKEGIEQALADVQSRIDKIIEETAGLLSKKFPKDMYNDCMKRFTSASGTDKRSALGGFGYDDLFGDMELTEENFGQVLKERHDVLKKASGSLDKSFKRWMDNISHKPGGANHKQSILKALDKIFGGGYYGLLDYIDALKQDEQENIKAE